MRVALALVAIVLAAAMPSVAADHDPVCIVPREAATAETPGATTYIRAAPSVATRSVDLQVWRETNGVPGLQTFGACGHAADQLVAHACPGRPITIPGSAWCVLWLD